MSSKPNSLRMSGIKTETLYGIVIRKMPLRKYMEFMAKGGTMLSAIADKLFPEMETVQIFSEIMTMNRESVINLITSLFTDAPDMIGELLAAMLDVPEEQLLDNSDIGLKELVELIDTWEEINDLSGFFEGVSKLSRRRKSSSQAHLTDTSTSP